MKKQANRPPPDPAFRPTPPPMPPCKPAAPERTGFNQVREFHEKFGHLVATEIGDPGEDLRKLRVALIAEELKEFAEACGMRMTIEFERDATKPVDLVEAADALGDIEYVTHGAHLVFGFPGPAIINEVHRANMSKLGDDGKPIYRADGKVLKGPNYRPPNIAEVLFAHGWKG